MEEEEEEWDEEKKHTHIPTSSYAFIYTANYMNERGDGNYSLLIRKISRQMNSLVAKKHLQLQI